MAIFKGSKSGYLASQIGKNSKSARSYSYVVTIFVAFASAEIYFLATSGLPLETKLLRSLLVLVFLFIVQWMFRGYSMRKIIVRRYQSGSSGEDELQRELEKLPDSYTVFPDLVINGMRGNIDFAVLGPTGIFSIECKSHNGRIGYSNGMLTRNGRLFDKDFIQQAEQEAHTLDYHLKIALMGISRTTPIIAFSNRRAWVDVPKTPLRGGVFVMHRKDLVRFIQNTPQTKTSLTQAQRILSLLADRR